VSRAQIRQQWRAHFRSGSLARPRAHVAPCARERGTATHVVRKATPAPSGLWVRIDHLELRGAGRVDDGQVAAALRSELQTLIATKGAPAGWGTDRIVDRVDAVPAAAATRVTAEWLGVQVGRAIYQLRSVERR